MSKNRLIINHVEDSIQLSWLRGQAAPRSAPPVHLEHPFDEKVLAELRWYLEEYLRFPYGLEPEKAKKTEQKLQNWGQQLFELVFPRTTKAWDFFQEATREGLDQCELGISSDDPAILNLPWELLYNSDYQFLAPSLAGMYRSLNEYAVRAEMPNLPQDKLNILLVIARPYGEKDVALKTIARPLLEALKPIQKQVNLKVLRPPSFEQFERELNEHKGFYHIVHFDGHGNFDPTSQGFQHSLGGLGQGVLVFEHPDGSPQIVTAAQIAQSLTNCRVPIFMLNACKSAQEGKGSFSSVATRLVALGAKGVVAMAYSVYAEAAKHFIGRVYEQLVRGNSVSVAVAAGRREILNKRQRPSPKGNLPLQDWLVPVLYQQETYAPFAPSNGDAFDIESFLEESTAPKIIGFPEEGAYGFVGRDYDILRLERSLRQNTVVLLQGMAGVGKTQLACGFAQWLVETQGRSLCFFQSFEHGASLVNVVNQVGRTVWGDKFSQYSWEQQQIAVLSYLKTQPCLLIWDNFEPVEGFPAGNEPLLLETERESLKQFLKELRGGRSQVLITSRREESWLDCGYTVQQLHGLSQIDAEEFAAKVLQSVGVERSALPSEYLELLKLLGGHPLSLRVVIPGLKSQTPAQIIEALDRGMSSIKDNPAEERNKSLEASLDFSFKKLSDRAQRHLPFLGLFCDQVNVIWLQTPPDSGDYGETYRAFFGENLEKEDWVMLLNEAAQAGIVELLGGFVYKIHPTLPWYLRQRLMSEHTAEEISELEKKLLCLYAVGAGTFRNLLVSDANLATFVLRIQEPNLLFYLRLAEQQKQWREAQSILQALHDIYMRSGRKAEFKVLRHRAIQKIGVSPVTVKANGEDAFHLWLFLRSCEADEELESANLEKAKSIYQEILDEIRSLNDPSMDLKIANFLHNLGVVAREQQQYEKAITYYQKSLEIYQNAGNPYNIVNTYHELGLLAQKQHQHDEAIVYYKALQIKEAEGDFYSAATEYFQLGKVFLLKQDFEKAFTYYYKSLRIREAVGDFYSAANCYESLGLIALFHLKFDQAVANYRKALQIFEDARSFYRAAIVYTQLSMIALKQQQYDDALAYGEKALQILEDTDDVYRVALVHAQLGMIAQAQQKYNEAITHYVKTLIFLQKPKDEYDFSPLNELGRMLKVLGEMQFKAIWREATGEECPMEWYEAIEEKMENLDLEEA